MNSRSLRRLAADHAALHNNDLPPNYLFDPSVDASSDLTQLDILLAGPTSTPYETGVFKLHLSIPPTYPNDPPKAYFRTKVFHPNIDPETGAVCVETLKRDWKSTLTLRHVLVTICCLLVYPNASSALNAEAGMLLEQQDGAGWDAFERRARLMTRLQAGVSKELREAVKAAQSRGEEDSGAAGSDAKNKDEEMEMPPRRTRRRGVLGGKHAQETPAPTERVEQAPIMPPPPRPFVVQTATDDVFGAAIRLPRPTHLLQTPRLQSANFDDDDSEVQDADQENNTTTRIPNFASKPIFQPGPARQRSPIPLGQVSIGEIEEDVDSSSFQDESMEAEYPPSPRKSPVKQRKTSDDFYAEPGPPSPRKESPRKKAPEYPPSPRKQSPVKRGGRGFLFQQPAPPNLARPELFRAESSRTAAGRIGAPALAATSSSSLFFTPDNQMHPALFSTTQDTPDVSGDTTMEGESEFEMSFEVLRQSERKKRNNVLLLASPPRRRKMRNTRMMVARQGGQEEGGEEEEGEWEVDGGDGDVEICSEPQKVIKTSPKVEKVRRSTRSVTKKKKIIAGAAAAVAAATAFAERQSKSPVPSSSPRTTGKENVDLNDEDRQEGEEKKSAEQVKMEALERKMWLLCGGDVDRWNRGDFGNGVFEIKASRW